MKCPECHMNGFNDPRHLGRHRRLVHNVIGAKHFKKDGVTPRKGFRLPHSLKCPECGEELSNTRNLGYHRRMAHGIPGKTAKYSAKHNLRRKQRNLEAKGEIVVHEPVTVETNLSPNGFEIPYISYLVGCFEEKCKAEAYDNNLAARPLIQDVAEYFFAKARSIGGNRT